MGPRVALMEETPLVFSTSSFGVPKICVVLKPGSETAIVG